MSELPRTSTSDLLGLGSVAQSALLAVSLAALPFFGSSAGQILAPTTYGLMSTSWAQAGPSRAFLVHAPVVVEDAVTSVATPSELLAQTREASGLTWDQLARYFGVSRRSVHLWAAGGRMSAANEELLAHLKRRQRFPLLFDTERGFLA